MTDKLLSALGLCKKAGALKLGFDPVKEAVLKGKAYLVLTASDLSEKTKKRVCFFCEELCDVADLPFTQAQLMEITNKPTGVFAVCDANLTKLVEKNLKENV